MDPCTSSRNPSRPPKRRAAAIDFSGQDGSGSETEEGPARRAKSRKSDGAIQCSNEQKEQRNRACGIYFDLDAADPPVRDNAKSVHDLVSKMCDNDYCKENFLRCSINLQFYSWAVISTPNGGGHSRTLVVILNAIESLAGTRWRSLCSFFRGAGVFFCPWSGGRRNPLIVFSESLGIPLDLLKGNQVFVEVCFVNSFSFIKRCETDPLSLIFSVAEAHCAHRGQTQAGQGPAGGTCRRSQAHASACFQGRSCASASGEFRRQGVSPSRASSSSRHLESGAWQAFRLGVVSPCPAARGV